MSKSNEFARAFGRLGDIATGKQWEPPAGLDFRVPDGIPPPPYAGYDVEDVMVWVSFERDAILPLMPPGIEPDDECRGAFVFGRQLKGSGIFPMAYGSIGIAIKGYDSPSGFPGIFWPVRNFSGEQAKIFFNTPHSSSIQLHRTDNKIRASVGPDAGSDLFRVSVRLTDRSERIAGTMYLYRPETIYGHRCVLPLSILCKRTTATPISVEIVGDGDALRRLKPRKVLGAFYDSEKTTIWGALMPLDNPDAAETERGQSLFFHFLSRLNQPTIVVDAECRISFMNQPAEALIGDYCLNNHGRLAGTTKDNEAAFQKLVESSTVGEITEAVLFGTRSLSSAVARAIPLQVRGVGQAAPSLAPLAVIAFAISTSGRGTNLSSATSLELLGLTHAEAKLASLVGLGVAPREAAERLDITENTVRTVLKRVYSKLQLTRQSELAVLVSRIDALGS